MTFLCKDKKFIFINLYKNAGSSIKYSLNKRVRKDIDLIPSIGFDELNSLTRKILRKLANSKLFSRSNKMRIENYKRNSHLDYKTLEKYLKDIDDFKIFAIVRNPSSW